MCGSFKRMPSLRCNTVKYIIKVGLPAFRKYVMELGLLAIQQYVMKFGLPAVMEYVLKFGLPAIMEYAMKLGLPATLMSYFQNHGPERACSSREIILMEQGSRMGRSRLRRCFSTWWIFKLR